jgi:RHS repeat-associated protein
LAYRKKHQKPQKKTCSYYPFGGSHKGYNNVVSSNGNASAQKFKFGGKELSEELGLNTYDFGARNYDPYLGRWMNIDPMAEFMRSQSPYNYGFNNPIYFSDYAGTIPWPMPEFFKNWVRKIDSKFGWRKRKGRKKKHHNGVDLNYSGGGNTDYGAPIVATHSGRVARINSDNSGSGGRYVVFESPDGSFLTKYLHLSSVVVSAGDEISEGQTIGLMGGSGFGKNLGYTSHLHYEVHKQNSNGGYSAVNPLKNGTPIDPQRWIMGPLESKYYFNSAMLFIYTGLSTESDSDSSSSSPSKSGGSDAGGGRSPVSLPPTLTPAPITPITPSPIDPGSIIIPNTPSPGPPTPIIIPPKPPCMDC